VVSFIEVFKPKFRLSKRRELPCFKSHAPFWTHTVTRLRHEMPRSKQWAQPGAWILRHMV